MRILQVIGSLAPRYGGPSTACPALCRALVEAGHEVTIYTTNASMKLEDSPLDRIVSRDGYAIRFFPAWRQPREFKISPELLAGLKQAVSHFDAVHIYSYCGSLGFGRGASCWGHGPPYLLHPHGSLDPFLLKRHTVRSDSTRMQSAIVSGTASLASCSIRRGARRVLGGEISDLQRDSPRSSSFGSTSSPNGLRNRDASAEERVRQMLPTFEESAEAEWIVFFGRIDFKKGLDLLVRAFAEVARRRPHAHLIIAGPEGPGYGAKVRRWLDREGMLPRVTFTGPLQGLERVALLRRARMLALLSYSENFGQVVAEAMAARVPVVISDRVNIWCEIEAAQSGIVVPCDACEAANAMQTLLEDPSGARQMGERGKLWAERNWTWPIVARQMALAYASLTGNAYHSRGRANWHQVAAKECELRLAERDEREPERQIKVAPSPAPGKPSTPSSDEQRAAQVEFYREAVNPEEEITRPRCYPRPVQFLLDYKIRTAWALLRNGRNSSKGRASDSESESVLVVCCGSGMEAEMVARTGRRVVALDISAEAVARARERATRFGFPLETMVGDAEHLPFADNSFDYVFVHDGLHHLPDAYRGVREMFRVARAPWSSPNPRTPRSPISPCGSACPACMRRREISFIAWTPRNSRGYFETLAPHAGACAAASSTTSRGRFASIAG